MRPEVHFKYGTNLQLIFYFLFSTHTPTSQCLVDFLLLVCISDLLHLQHDDMFCLNFEMGRSVYKDQKPDAEVCIGLYK